jgi:hypothetical protein
MIERAIIVNYFFQFILKCDLNLLQADKKNPSFWEGFRQFLIL